VIAAGLLAVLVVIDCALAGFRAAAGRYGSLDKRRYYYRAVARGATAGVVLVALFGVAVHLASAWTAGTAAATTLVWIYGTYATVVLVAFGFYFAPIGPYRVLTSVIVFGPLTLVRRSVIVAGLAVVVFGHHPMVVRGLAIAAGAALLAVEPWLGRRYASLWRQLHAPRIEPEQSDPCHESARAR
jgi:hypothetical protein